LPTLRVTEAAPLELQEQQLQHSLDHLDDQAKAALGQGRDDLAREALSRKATAQQQIQGMEPQRQQLDDEEDKMEQTLNALRQRVNTFRSQKEVIKAQYTAASAMTSVNEDAAGISESFSDSGAALRGLRPRSPACRPEPRRPMSCSSPAC